jgi:hypothetical protein
MNSPQQNIRAYLNAMVNSTFIQAEDAVKNEAKKKIMELRAKLPTPDELARKITSHLCDTAAMDIIEGIYKFIRKTLTSIMKHLQSVNNFLTKILTKLREIETKVLAKINNILDKLKKLLGPLNIILRVAPVSLAAQTGPAANGAVINRLGESMSTAKKKIGDIVNTVSGFTTAISFYAEKAFGFINLISNAQNAVNQLYQRVEKLLIYLEFLWGSYFGGCAVDDQSEVNQEGNPNQEILELTAQDIFDAEDMGLPSDTLSNYFSQLNQYLNLAGKTRMAERLYQMKLNGLTQQWEVDYLKEYKVVLKDIEPPNIDG